MSTDNHQDPINNNSERSGVQLLRPPGFKPSEIRDPQVPENLLSRPGPRPPNFRSQSIDDNQRHSRPSVGSSVDDRAWSTESAETRECTIAIQKAAEAADAEQQELLRQNHEQAGALRKRLMTLESLIQSRDGPDCKPDPQTTPEDLRLSKVQVRVRMNMLKAELLLLEAEAKKLSVVQSNSITQRTMHIEYAEEYHGRLSAMSAGAHSEGDDSELRWSDNETCLHRAAASSQDLDQEMVLQVVKRLSTSSLDPAGNTSYRSESSMFDECAMMLDEPTGHEVDGKKPSVSEMAMGMGIFTHLNDQERTREAGARPTDGSDCVVKTPSSRSSWIKTPTSVKDVQRTVIKAEDISPSSLGLPAHIL